jgi:hypothetical protein
MEFLRKTGMRLLKNSCWNEPGSPSSMVRLPDFCLRCEASALSLWVFQQAEAYFPFKFSLRLSVSAAKKSTDTSKPYPMVDPMCAKLLWNY